MCQDRETARKLEELFHSGVWKALCETNLDETREIAFDPTSYDGVVNGIAYCLFHQNKHTLHDQLRTRKNLTAQDIEDSLRRFRGRHLGPQAKINRDELRSSAKQLLEKVTFQKVKNTRENRSLKERLHDFKERSLSTEKITKIELILRIIGYVATGIIAVTAFFGL
ncbi:MAG: hypothetical protein IPN28_03540 [Alphaproteobacteria bacterium]|jgi:hypothetical protein|nr:MAG: hypothetical protein IPN28_03540 [Alphaproteobacteria bacterium]